MLYSKSIKFKVGEYLKLGSVFPISNGSRICRVIRVDGYQIWYKYIDSDRLDWFHKESDFAINNLEKLTKDQAMVEEL